MRYNILTRRRANHSIVLYSYQIMPYQTNVFTSRSISTEQDMILRSSVFLRLNQSSFAFICLISPSSGCLHSASFDLILLHLSSFAFICLLAASSICLYSPSASVFILLHLSSFCFIYFHSPSSVFIRLHLSSFAFTCLHSP